ncbi:MAG: hypothetical protein WBP83_08320 [Nitrososphaeraceae archaeon]
MALNPKGGRFNNAGSSKTQVSFGLRSFFFYAKGLYAAALGIEILCIAAAEIGENTGLFLFGFNTGGIVIAYVMGYTLAGFIFHFRTIESSVILFYDGDICPCCKRPLRTSLNNRRGKEKLRTKHTIQQ